MKRLLLTIALCANMQTICMQKELCLDLEQGVNNPRHTLTLRNVTKGTKECFEQCYVQTENCRTNHPKTFAVCAGLIALAALAAFQWIFACRNGCPSL